MAIRFRCAYCNQLMGIARRKAGTVVRCPTCAGQVVVPNPDAAGVEDVPDQPNQPLFERSDFDNLFDAPGKPPPGKKAAAAPPAALPAGAWGTHAEPSFDVEQVVVPNPPAGIVLSATKATILTVVAVASVVIAFVIGYMLGRP